MAVTFQFDLVTPEKLLLSEEAVLLTLPGAEGYFGVLPGHAPFISQLKAGELTLGEGADRVRYAVSGGYAEVLPERVTVLTGRAVLRDAIDPDQALADRREAERQLATLIEGDAQIGVLKNRIAFADACLAVRPKEN